MPSRADSDDDRMPQHAASEPTRGSGRAKAEWLPAALDRVRISRTVEVPIEKAERALRIRPEQIAQVAYKSSRIVEDGATVILSPARSWKWLQVPARIDFLSPSAEHHGAIISLSWRARRFAGCFPVMEADILVHGDGHYTELVLEGTYRPPLGLAGLIFDRLVGRWVASATAERFVDALATSLEKNETISSRLGRTRHVPGDIDKSIGLDTLILKPSQVLVARAGFCLLMSMALGGDNGESAKSAGRARLRTPDASRWVRVLVDRIWSRGLTKENADLDE